MTLVCSLRAALGLPDCEPRFGAARQGARDLRHTRIGPGSRALRDEGVNRVKQFWRLAGVEPSILVQDVVACAALTSEWIQVLRRRLDSAASRAECTPWVA